MSDRKSNPAKDRPALTSVADSPEPQNSALQLRAEVDKLALLLEQVKRQSDRVQEVADAMGCRLLSDPALEALLGADIAQIGHTEVRPRSQHRKLLRFSADTRPQGTRPSL